MAELKTKPNDNKVIDFINRIDKEQLKTDCFKLLELLEQVTHEEPKMWGDSIVGFGTYHYRYSSGREGDWFLAGFSPRKQNLTIYIMSGFEAYDDIMNQLGKYKTGSSCLYVKKLDDINIEKLMTLVEKSVEDVKKRYGSVKKE